MADVTVRFLGDTRKLDKDIAGIKKDAKGLGGEFDQAGVRVTKFGKTGTAAGLAIKRAMGVVAAGAVVGFAADAVGAFSDLEESLNAVNVQFGEGADAIKDFGEGAADAVGLANSEFNQLSVVTGATLSAFIEDEQAIAAETIRLTQRASDMASVFNTDVGDALTALQAALRGEMEPIRRFGVSLDDMTIRAHAVEMGLADTTAEVTAQEKAMAALDLIYEQTDKTAGDFANTQDSIANKQKILAARFENTKAAIGEALAPAMEELLVLLEKAVPLLEKAAGAVNVLVKAALGLEAAIFGNANPAMEAFKEAQEDAAEQAGITQEVVDGINDLSFDDAISEARRLSAAYDEALGAQLRARSKQGGDIDLSGGRPVFEGGTQGDGFNPGVQEAPVVINMNVDATGQTDPETFARRSAEELDREIKIYNSGQNRPI